MKEVKICGVVLSSRKQRKETITGINWFDMEISEFVDNCEKETYRESSAAKRKLCEIEGILKYLRMSHVITGDEYEVICNQIMKTVFPGEEENNEAV